MQILLILVVQFEEEMKLKRIEMVSHATVF